MNTHAPAVERAITASAPVLTDAHAPLLELCRALARQMDETPDPSTRLVAAYLSVLKDLRRAQVGTPPAPQAATRLAIMRGAHGHGSGTDDT